MWLVLAHEGGLAIFTHLEILLELHNLSFLIVQIPIGDSCLAIEDLIFIDTV